MEIYDYPNFRIFDRRGNPSFGQRGYKAAEARLSANRILENLAKLTASGTRSFKEWQGNLLAAQRVYAAHRDCLFEMEPKGKRRPLEGVLALQAQQQRYKIFLSAFQEKIDSLKQKCQESQNARTHLTETRKKSNKVERNAKINAINQEINSLQEVIQKLKAIYQGAEQNAQQLPIQIATLKAFTDQSLYLRKLAPIIQIREKTKALFFYQQRLALSLFRYRTPRGL